MEMTGRWVPAVGRQRMRLPFRRGSAAAIALLVAAGCAGPRAQSPKPTRPARTDLAPSVASSPAAVPSPPEPSPTPAVTELPPLDDAPQVADELIKAETAIRAASTPPQSIARHARIQQAAYRKIVANPQFKAHALSKAPPELKSVIEANVSAGAELRALTKPVATLPSWKIVTPPPAEELRRYYAEAEKEFGIPWSYLAAIHLVESRMGRIRGTSSAGAQGPMQFIPGTWARYGKGDINNPRDAIFAAARYLKASGAPSAMARSLYAYNHSDRYVRAVTAYAEQMLGNERTYLGYYHWQVYVRTTNGDMLLEEGYGGT